MAQRTAAGKMSPMRHLPRWITGSLLALLPACSGERPGAATADLEARAARLEENGRWSEAARLYLEAALRGEPRAGVKWIQKGILACLMGDQLAEAKAFAGEVLRKDPSYHEVLFFLGDGQRVTQHYEEALATLKKLLERAPDHAQGGLAAAYVLARLGRSEEALPLFEKFLALHEEGSKRLEAEVEYSRALRWTGKVRPAAEHLARVLEVNPHHLPALAEAAQVFYSLGKADLARELRQLHQKLARLGHQLSSDDETKLYATGPRQPSGRARQALQAADRREFLQAISGLKAALAEDPGDVTIARALAKLWLRLKRFEELKELAAGLSARGGPAADLYLFAAEALEGLGRADEARQEAARAMAALDKVSLPAGGEEGLPPLEIRLRAIRLVLDSGADAGTASAWIQRAALLHSPDPRLALYQARLDLQLGDWKRALARLEALPGDFQEAAVEFRRARAEALGLSGDLRFAAREIMALIKEAPGSLENFAAFERIFGAKTGEPEVARVLDLKRRLEEQRGQLARLVLEAAGAPLDRSAPHYLELGRKAAALGDREGALDFLSLAADLDPQDAQALAATSALLRAPGEIFLRINALRRMLSRSPRSGTTAASPPAQALAGLVQAYLDLDLRLEEAESLAARLAAIQPGEEAARRLEAARSRRALAGEAR